MTRLLVTNYYRYGIKIWFLFRHIKDLKYMNWFRFVW